MRVRIPYIPSPAERSDLTVLLSHRSTEFERARAFGQRLSHLGFAVRLLSPGALPAKSEVEVAGMLKAIIREIDVCCVLVSENASASDWVRFEYQEAAAMIGRVMFLGDRTFRGKVGFDRRSTHGRPHAAELIVKHSALLEEDVTDELLLVELCNDPDEGWFDGSEIYKRRTARRLKVESEIRKFVRSCVMYDPRYAGKTIVDVIPFSLNDSPTRDRHEIFRWVLESFGRVDLRAAFRRGELNAFHAPYFVGDDNAVARFLGEEDEGMAHALLFTEPA